MKGQTMTKQTKQTTEQVPAEQVPAVVTGDDVAPLVASLTAATTPAQYEQVIADVQAASNVLEARTFDAIVRFARVSGDAIMGWYRTTVQAKGETPAVSPTWADVTKVLPIVKGGSVGGRAYSTLSEDFDFARYTSGDVHRTAWDEYRKGKGKDVPRVNTPRGYLTFARRAVTGTEGNRAMGKDRAIALAETARKDAETKRSEREQAAKDARTTLANRLAARPRANLVEGIDVITCGEASALTSEQASKLSDALAMVASILSDAEQASKGDETVTPDDVVTPDAVITPAVEAHVTEGTADVASIVAAVLAAMGKGDAS